MSSQLLQNQTAIITGADRGVGRGIAIEMARAGANIVIACRDKAMAQTAQKEIAKFGTQVIIIPTDITREEQRDNLLKQTIKKIGQINILVNNAAIPSSRPFLQTTPHEIQTVINTNLVSQILLTHQTLPYMENDSVILFTSSTHSHITALMPAYSAAKAAIEMFVKELALELADKHIRINAVAPGIVATKGESNNTNSDVPLGQSSLPEDIGQTMVFLTSRNARHITGQTITVDGGFSLAHFHYWKKKKRII